jgi:hypothetical protein
MSFYPDKPYNDLPLLPPKVELETKAVLRKAIAANKALAELNGAREVIPNQTGLAFGILAQAVPDNLSQAVRENGHSLLPNLQQAVGAFEQS